MAPISGEEEVLEVTELLARLLLTELSLLLVSAGLEELLDCKLEELTLDALLIGALVELETLFSLLAMLLEETLILLLDWLAGLELPGRLVD